MEADQWDVTMAPGSGEASANERTGGAEWSSNAGRVVVVRRRRRVVDARSWVDG